MDERSDSATVSATHAVVATAADAAKFRLAALLEATKEFVGVFDSDLRALDLSAAFRQEFARLYGFAIEPGDRICDLLAHLPAERRTVEDLLRRGASGEAIETQIELGDPRRFRRVHRMSVRPVWDGAGAPIGAALTARDVTTELVSQDLAAELNERLEHSAFERAAELGRAEALAGAVFDAMVEGVLVLDAEGRVVTTNTAFRELHGLDEATEPRTLAGYGPLFEATTLEGLPLPEDQWPARQALRGERVRRQLIRVIRKATEEEFVASYSAAPVIVSGKTLNAVVTVQDVTDLLRSNRALKVSEERYRFLADSVPPIVWTADATGQFEWANLRWREFTGVDFEVASRDGWRQVVHPDDYPKVAVAVRNAFERGISLNLELRMRRADGEYRWMLGRAAPMRADDGEITGWFGACTDIHDQKTIEGELERRVQERTSQLTAAVGSLERFTYSVSHDLRAPLRAIVATSRILLEDSATQLRSEERILLERQATNATRLGVLIDELLHLARISRLELRRKTFDLSAVAQEVASGLATRGWPSPPDVFVAPGLEANADPYLARMLLQHLLENAHKYSPNGGEVRVERRGDAFVVSDRGIGFDPAYEPKLWLPFERLVLDGDYPGTGIGLAIVHRIVERHGGRTWAEGAPGKGASFYFTFG